MLTERQRRFCEEFVTDLNGAAACVRAGYSERTARTIANHLLTKVDIQRQIATLKKERSERLQIESDQVVRRLAEIAFANLTDVCKWSEGRLVFLNSEDLPPKASGAVREVSVVPGRYGDTMRIRMEDKVRALAVLLQHLDGIELKAKLSEIEEWLHDFQANACAD